jgi:hemerythrin superfamily protein
MKIAFIGITMNAIELLESQHREIERLFSRIEKVTKPDAREKLFVTIADKLAIHAAIEEHRFYPAVKEKRTEDLLLEALEEHLRIKRVLADLLEREVSDESFDAKIKILREQVEHHFGEAESDLFPKVRKLLAEDELDALGQAMSAEHSELTRDVRGPRTTPPQTVRTLSIAPTTSTRRRVYPSEYASRVSHGESR